jgi:glycosyltransferase involved in cell wall biosynthesis
MRIGIIVDNELNNDKRVLREAKILADGGHEVFALCFRFDGTIEKEFDGITISRIYITRRFKDILFFLFNSFNLYERLWSSWICRFILEYNPDVIHAHDLYMSKCSYTGIRRSGKKVSLVLDLHENFSYQVTSYNWTKGFLRNLISKPQKWKKKEGQYLGFADRIIVLSDEFRDQLTTEYPSLKPENFCSLPNVPDVGQMESFKPEPGKLPFIKKSPLLFYFGIVAERRGIFSALTAFSELAGEGAEIDFLIVGPVDKADLPRFNKLTGSKELKGRVIYIPWIDLAELPSYLEICDICIAPFLKNPQHESGVANKIFDYMLGKKPLIVSDCLPQQRLVEKYSCGLVYRNKAELKEAILTLAGNPVLASEMGKRGYEAIAGEFNTEKIKDKLLSFYNNILK